MPGKDDLTFYFSGERRWQRDRSPTFLTNVSGMPAPRSWASTPTSSPATSSAG